ncbi:hypothetical protein DH2020_020953 [Rehmannia glutinosa]|uniref:Uncharacterized protein n=1 Tax=Rehmannia glutinosa TaxID=99300 RepID=A0ABR0W9L6_REHGL
MTLFPITAAGLVSPKTIKKKHLILPPVPGADNDKREKIRQKNEKHQRQKERRAQELHERCSGYLMSRKLEALAQQIVAMGGRKNYVSFEGDLDKAEEILKAQKEEPFKPEETGDPPTKRDEKDFNYTKIPATVGSPVDPGAKTMQMLKKVPPKSEWTKPQQIATPAEKAQAACLGLHLRWTGKRSSILQCDYANVDWSLDHGSVPPRPNGLWASLNYSVQNNGRGYDSFSYGLGGKSAMRPVLSNGNGAVVPGVAGRVVSSDSTSGGSREWSSPFEEKDIFSLPRQFVSSPSL